MNYAILKKIDFYEGVADRALKGMEFAEQSGNFYLCALNSRQIFKARLMQALIMLRANMDAHTKLLQCVNDIKNNSQKLEKIDGKENIFDSLPIERGGLVAFLLGSDFVLENFSDFNLSFGRVMDIYLLKILFSNCSDVFNENIILADRYLSDNFSDSLQVLTYSNYFKIFGILNSDSDKMSFIENGFKLFSLRRNDPFYSGGDQTEGGGSDNKIIVDYRLEAILKKIRYNGERNYQ